MDKEKIKKAVREILIAIGEDPEREGLRDTPLRVAKMYEEILSGYKEKPEEILSVTFHEERYNEIIILKNIPIYSMCEHHLLPFFGKCHVAYLPKDNIITGLSKIPRVVDCFARRLQLQERLTQQIADSLMELKPLGVAVIIEAEHLCLTMRGVKKPGTKMITSALRGIFLKDERTRNELMRLLK
ncbi:MAG: GTP cyclohydrolase I FolE [Caldiserica bacterium]|nr:MAG: GTP cyclohydrolase I FolE [Caldisericota bacterium]